MGNNIPCGGWCPRGRIAEDGIISVVYPLIETNSSEYISRTNTNILESDGTLIIFISHADEGTINTASCCKTNCKPVLQVNLEFTQSFDVIYSWIIKNGIQTLNIAGPRESNNPGVYSKTLNFLKNFLEYIGRD